MFLHSLSKIVAQRNFFERKFNKNKITKITRSTTIVFLATFLFFTTTLIAEKVDVLGYPVEVNSLVKVSDNLYKLDYNSKVSILKKDELNSYLLTNSFKKNTNFNLNSLKSLFNNLFNSKKLDLASTLFNILLQKKELSNLKLEEVLKSLEAESNLSLFFKNIVKGNVLNANRNSVNKLISINLFKSDPNWLRKNAPIYFYTFFDDLKLATLNNFYTYLIEKDFNGLEKSNKALKTFFGSNFSDSKEAIVLYDQIKQLEASEEASIKDEYLYFKSVYQYLIKSKNTKFIPKEVYVTKIHSLIEKAKEKDLLNTATLLFSTIPYNFRTPTTHKLALNLLDNLPNNFLLFAKDESLFEFFSKLSKDDPQIYISLINFFEKNISWHLARSEFLSANLLLEKLKVLYSFKSKVVPNRIYVDFAKANILHSNKIRAKYYLSKTSGFLNPLDYIWLLVHSYYVSLYLLFLALLLFMGLIVVRSFRIKSVPTVSLSPFSKLFQKLRMRGYGYGLRQKAQQNLEKLDGKKRFVSTNVKAQDVRVIEFLRLMAVFELDQSANLQNLKDSYRKKVKKVHPDVSKSKEDAKQFVYLTTTYERILELYSELYGQ